MTNFFIKPLLYKWIIILLLLPFGMPAFANISTVDQKIEKINQLYQKEQKEKILQIVGKVDEAIDSVIKLPDLARKRYAVLIALAGKKYDIDPRIMIAILVVESSFRQSAKNVNTNKTTDYSIAQINYETWKKGFKKMSRAPLNKERLVSDEAYAIFRMAEILRIYKDRFESQDKIWFARYNSSTIKYKTIYKNKLVKEFKKLIEFGPNMLTGLPSNPQVVADLYLGPNQIKGF